jgi:hypothetical protein
MRKRRLNRRTPLIALFVVLALALLLGGIYQSARDEASAATIITVFPTLTIQPLLIASEFSPADGDTEVALNRNVTVRFNRDLDASTLDGHFYLKKAGPIIDLLVPATISYSPLLDVATLNPNADLVPDATYRVTLTDDIESTGGLALFNDQTWSFRTITPPAVLTKTPASGAMNVPVGQTISVTFDKDMDWSTVGDSSFYLQKSGGGMVTAIMNHSVDKRTATLVPPAGLQEGETYIVTLTTAVRAENGLSLESTVVWNFTTAADAPQVIAKVPAHGATDVTVSQTISAAFDKAMDPATLTSATFYLKKSGGSPLPAAVTYSAATKTATLDPLADMETGATYEVTLTGAVESEAGASLAGAPVVWTFTTASGGGGSPVFTDVVLGETPYAAAIIELADRGVVIGKGGGLFGPSDLVSRQQFAKMIVLSLGLTVTGAEICPFSDVSAQIGDDPLYPSKYVAVCAAAEITKGKSATTFDPWASITHQQLISMVARASGLPDPPSAFTPNFAAGQFYPNEHYLNARKAQYGGLLDGLLGVGPTYDFFAASTRGECSQILYNLINLLGL